ncbi:dysbindin [Galleria mellonella]|uniref:Dysbindin n=1 Tax=Galleria mellonella TaxID=7137 RepID=A0A6J1WC22_GALME|nr:dysbindin [Galleria mellonella]
MLGNLKEFISVVQDGLSANNNLKQTLQEVQKVKNIFKDKQKVNSDGKVNYGAGGALLEKYQEQWAELHQNADRNAKAADEVDKLILELHESTKIKLQNAHALSQGLMQIPALTAAVAQCMDSLKNVQHLLKSVEDDLVEFEDIVERRAMEKWKLDHHYHLTLYKEKKMAALEDIRNQLAKNNTELSFEKEKRELAELQARRENSSVAFQNDMARYLNSGIVPVGPSGPPSSPRMTLEQVELEDDGSDLEKFLDKLSH